MEVMVAPPAIQSLFDMHVDRLALRLGYKGVEDYIKRGLGGVVYHYTLNFMGGHSFDHNDEWMGDGPGWWIWNLVLQGSGILFFLEDMARKGAKSGKKLPMSGVWQQAGTCAGFSGEARIFMKHGVFRSPEAKRLPTEEEFESSSKMDNIRIVASFRGGELPTAAKEDWHTQWWNTYDMPNPNVKQEPADKPRRGSRKKTPKPATGKLSMVDISRANLTNPRKPAANMPKHGDVLRAPNNSTWSSATVKAVNGNFVQTYDLVSTATANLEPLILKMGLKVQVRMPEKSKNVRTNVIVTINVLAVGVIYGPGKTQPKYRAIVIRRNVKGKPGELETIAASAFPLRDYCKVHTHTHHLLLFVVTQGLTVHTFLETHTISCVMSGDSTL